MNPVPLVLVPGLSCDAALWAPQVELLRDVAQCWVADVTRDDTVEAMARRVLEESPFETFALAGLSMGGFVVLAMMRIAPERVHRLALLDTNARPDIPERARERLVFMSLAQREGSFLTISGRLMARLIHPSRLQDGALVRAIQDMAERISLDGYCNQQRAIIARPDSRPVLGAIACPTLVLCGREDELSPVEMHEEMAAAIPGARLVVLEECGHMTTLERPLAVNDCMRSWLTTPAT